MNLKKAPELITSEWVNGDDVPPTLEGLSGRVILLECFQMLCPGCVSHALPQARRADLAFRDKGLVVLGLHSVFEHHEAQGHRAALAAFMHENRITFPVAIDAPARSGFIPQTMTRYGMQGTPTTLLIDAGGHIRMQRFGSITDLELGAAIGSLLNEAGEPAAPTTP
ncbi:redoxin domain-containing protein [Maricaulis maris]|uniref:Peroxiredoxin n=1 Tax=Maricaulis maris TaxID=74318 RepID=A0A495DMM7_9PROT|nr:redoxin domain-containing protein [Maricaulis maris]RKR04172.1 peroxiredoxin [Maricaulis maris]